MINKVKKIKDLGIFSDYSWQKGLPDFKKYNIIYGWNGSGKTTLSKLFDALEAGKLSDYPDLKYDIEAESSSYKQINPFSRKIRVFNEEYITNNVQLLEGKAKPIFILGEKNKKLADQIKEDESELEKLQSKFKLAEQAKGSIETRKNNIFTDTARTISQNISGDSTRNYRKPNAESDFRGIKNKKSLTDHEIKTAKSVLAQQQKELLKLLPDFQDIQTSIDSIIREAKSLLKKKATAITIERLKNNKDLSDWVEEGIKLHSSHKSKNCEYCSQPLPEKRLKELANHFSEADQELKNDIENILSKLRPIFASIRDLELREAANVYEELQKEYKKELKKLSDNKNNLIDELEKLGKEIADKKTKTTESIALKQIVSTKDLVTSIKSINELIDKHNEKTNNFEKEKEDAREKLKSHYLSSIFNDVKGLEKEIKTKSEEIDLYNNGNSKKSILGIKDLTSRINTNRSKISSSHKACKEINDKLKTFLGHKELTFEVEDEGYVIKRQGKIASNLSEGEKTAVAFVHFVVCLKDQDFDSKEGIIFIDDPISSLDSNSLFQAFAFLKESVKDAHQIFISTHNFEFLRLVINWMKGAYRGKTNQEKNVSYYMINNKFPEDGNREAYIAELDELLKDHESEYNYLFKRLNEFKTDGTIASVYDVPNIARKVLETFLMFRIPNNQSTYTKLESIDFDKMKKTAIYKFTNDQSHITGKGFDPSLVPETQKNVTHLLEMIEAIFPEHYKILIESIGEES